MIIYLNVNFFVNWIFYDILRTSILHVKNKFYLGIYLLTRVSLFFVLIVWKLKFLYTVTLFQCYLNECGFLLELNIWEN